MLVNDNSTGAQFAHYVRTAKSLLFGTRIGLAACSQDERYRRGMELLRAGYARHLLLGASSDSHYFGHTFAEYAEAFLKQDAKQMSSQVSVCAFELDSTLTETGYVGKCLEPFHPVSLFARHQ
jgi:hypothetical protein